MTGKKEWRPGTHRAGRTIHRLPGEQAEGRQRQREGQVDPELRRSESSGGRNSDDGPAGYAGSAWYAWPIRPARAAWSRRTARTAVGRYRRAARVNWAGRSRAAYQDSRDIRDSRRSIRPQDSRSTSRVCRGSPECRAGYPAGVYPGQPIYPGQAGYPANPPVPGQPVYPGQPGYPTQQIQPGVPLAGQPIYPGQAGYPANPPVPGQPVYPGQPGYPVQPVQPVPVPGQPIYPGQPGYPANPPVPGQPVYPALAGISDHAGPRLSRAAGLPRTTWISEYARTALSGTAGGSPVDLSLFHGSGSAGAGNGSVRPARRNSRPRNGTRPAHGCAENDQ